MEELGDGATGVIYGYRDPGKVGHYFNVVNNNGQIQFLDFQKEGSAVMEASEVVSDYKDLWFIRTTQ